MPFRNLACHALLHQVFAWERSETVSHGSVRLKRRMVWRRLARARAQVESTYTASSLPGLARTAWARGDTYVSGGAGTLLPYYLKEEHEWGLDLQELHDQTEKVCHS